MIQEMKKRFLVVLILLMPLTILSPMMMTLFNYRVEFPGDILLASIVFFMAGDRFSNMQGTKWSSDIRG